MEAIERRHNYRGELRVEWSVRRLSFSDNGNHVFYYLTWKTKPSTKPGGTKARKALAEADGYVWTDDKKKAVRFDSKAAAEAAIKWMERLL